MRRSIALVVITALAGAAFFALGSGPLSRLWAQPSTEVAQLTPAKRVLLQRLRTENKFQPNNYPPLGYTQPDTPEDGATAIAAVNEVIDTVLAQPDRNVQAAVVSDAIAKGMKKVDLLATEDRDRTQGYTLEIWYIVGFKGPTGHFEYGSYFKKPPGYGEPLPPGWTAPDKPRPIG
jgi:hypothetical protein